MIDYRLYLVTDDPSRYAGNWLDNVVAAVEGGVTCVQYRDTENEPEAQYARVLHLQDALKPYGVPVIVNNDAHLAAETNADGVHVGQHDMPVSQVRDIVGPNCEIGLSITDISQLTANSPLFTPHSSLVSCLGIGPVFDARKTKADAATAMGVDGLRRILDSQPSTLNSQLSTLNPHPSTVAIGGITLDNAKEVLSTGVGGIAVVSAFSKSDNSYEVAKSFSLLLDHCRL